MPCLDDAGLVQFFHLTYVFLSFSWLYILSVVLFALYDDGLLVAPNTTTTTVVGNETAAEAMLAALFLLASNNVTNGTVPNPQTANPFPFIPSLLLGFVLVGVVTHIIEDQTHRRIRDMPAGAIIMYVCWLMFEGCLLYTSPSPRDRG